MSRYAILITVAVVLGFSIPAVALVPFGPFPGLDFHNLDVFHHCFARDNPYLATGAACGDYLDRDMTYPPLLYWSFAWTRLAPLSVSYLIWAVVILVGVLLALVAWVPRGRHDGAVVIFVGLMMLGYPVLFAVERGNNDVLVLILWTIAAWLFGTGRAGLSGATAGTAVALKLYPVFAAVVVAGGLIWWAWREAPARRRLLMFGAGGLASVMVASVVPLDQNLLYIKDEFAQLTSVPGSLSPWSHTLDPIAPARVTWLLSLPLLATWVFASAKRLPSDPALVFAGGLAISTYFSSVSNDYNLITVYPLLTLLFVRAMARPWSPLTFGLLMLGLIAIMGNRVLFAWSELALELHIALQWLWLFLTGLAVAAGHLRDGEAATPPRTWVPLRGVNTLSSLVEPDEAESNPGPVARLPIRWRASSGTALEGLA